jgi:single-strand DNA-binding protein
MKQSQTGLAICKFSVAVNEKYKDTEHTEWFNCTAFGRTGELIREYFQKGDLILITDAKMKTREYEQDGQRKWITDIIVNQFQFVGGRKNSNNQAYDGGTYGGGTRREPDTGYQPDDIPF